MVDKLVTSPLPLPNTLQQFLQFCKHFTDEEIIEVNTKHIVEPLKSLGLKLDIFVVKFGAIRTEPGICHIPAVTWRDTVEWCGGHSVFTVSPQKTENHKHCHG